MDSSTRWWVSRIVANLLSIWASRITLDARISGLVASPFTTSSAVVSLHRYSTFKSYFNVVPTSETSFSSSATSQLHPIQIQRSWSALHTRFLACFRRARIYLRGSFADGLATLAPSTALSFFTYGTCKTYSAQMFNINENTAILHASAGLIAGFSTPVFMNCIQTCTRHLHLAFIPAVNRPASQINMVRARPHVIHVPKYHQRWGNSCPGAAKLMLHMTLYEKLKSSWLNALDKESRHTSAITGFANRYYGIAAAAGWAQTVAVILSHPLYVRCHFL